MLGSCRDISIKTSRSSRCPLVLSKAIPHAVASFYPNPCIASGLAIKKLMTLVYAVGAHFASRRRLRQAASRSTQCLTRRLSLGEVLIAAAALRVLVLISAANFF